MKGERSKEQHMDKGSEDVWQDKDDGSVDKDKGSEDIIEQGSDNVDKSEAIEDNVDMDEGSEAIEEDNVDMSSEDIEEAGSVDKDDDSWMMDKSMEDTIAGRKLNPLLALYALIKDIATCREPIA